MTLDLVHTCLHACFWCHLFYFSFHLHFQFPDEPVQVATSPSYISMDTPPGTPPLRDLPPPKKSFPASLKKPFFSAPKKSFPSPMKSLSPPPLMKPSPSPPPTESFCVSSPLQKHCPKSVKKRFFPDSDPEGSSSSLSVPSLQTSSHSVHRTHLYIPNRCPSKCGCLNQGKGLVCIFGNKHYFCQNFNLNIFKKLFLSWIISPNLKLHL